MAFDMDRMSTMMGVGAMLGSGLGNLFGGFKNPSKDAMKYMNQMSPQLMQMFAPYINAGNAQINPLQQQYASLMGDPGAMLSKIGAGYKQSPGFDFALKQALGGAGHAAAAGGMAGSPQHEQQNMELASNLASQDYNQYIQNALGLYGQGLHGAQGMYGMGAQAGMGLGEDLASILGQKAKLAYEGRNAENQHAGGTWGSLLGGLGGLASIFWK